MPFVSGFLRVKKRFDRWGRPVDPDYGVDEGVDPGWGVDGPDDIDDSTPPLRPHPRPPTKPIDPDVPGGPLEPIEPGAPDNALPPGTIIPPLPPDLDIGFHGKAYLGVTLVYKGRRHHHHVVVNIPEVPPERPTPPAGGIGGTPPQRPVPGQPPR